MGAQPVDYVLQPTRNVVRGPLYRFDVITPPNTSGLIIVNYLRAKGWDVTWDTMPLDSAKQTLLDWLTAQLPANQAPTIALAPINDAVFFTIYANWTGDATTWPVFSDGFFFGPLETAVVQQTALPATADNPAGPAPQPQGPDQQTPSVPATMASVAPSNTVPILLIGGAVVLGAIWILRSKR